MHLKHFHTVTVPEEISGLPLKIQYTLLKIHQSYFMVKYMQLNSSHLFHKQMWFALQLLTVELLSNCQAPLTTALGSSYLFSHSSFLDPFVWLILTIPSDNKLEVTYLWRSALTSPHDMLSQHSVYTKLQLSEPMQLMPGKPSWNQKPNQSSKESLQDSLQIWSSYNMLLAIILCNFQLHKRCSVLPLNIFQNVYRHYAGNPQLPADLHTVSSTMSLILGVIYFLCCCFCSKTRISLSYF